MAGQVRSRGDLEIVPLDDFVEGLKRISDGVITQPILRDYMSSRIPSREDLSRYERWNPKRHTRNLIFRNSRIELMLICWNPGDTTPLHTHNGQLGWMAMVEGRLRVENFRLRRCNAPENQQVVGIDCLTGATEIEMDLVGTEIVEPGGPLNTVDKTQTIHRITNPEEWDEPALSLHVYSLPIASCVVFDLEKQRCTRRDLFFDE